MTDHFMEEALERINSQQRGSDVKGFIASAGRLNEFSKSYMVFISDTGVDDTVYGMIKKNRTMYLIIHEDYIVYDPRLIDKTKKLLEGRYKLLEEQYVFEEPGVGWSSLWRLKNAYIYSPSFDGDLQTTGLYTTVPIS